MKQEDTTTQLSGFAVTQQLILGELDTEIRVRERLQEAVESRIAWATSLQSSLGAVTETHGSGSRLDVASANPFQVAAADALDVAEAPLLPILSRQARFINRPTDIAPAPSPTSSTNLYSRPHTRHTRLRRSSPAIQTPPKFLYFRDTSTDTIARLSCPDCSRSDFPRVQSLLNHCRLQHGREFGSHDDCIRGCAVHVSKHEESWIIENGSELRQSGLPSLRRLFEIAVGSASGSLGIASATDASTRQPGVCQEDNCIQEEETPQASTPIHTLSSTHLSRTLGHHAESPALAPFLGRAPKRRGIIIHDENTPVDIDGGKQTLVRRRWRKPFIHRSRARPSLDVAIPAEAPVPQRNPVITQGTRFHVVARVAISDRSLWIPVDRRSDSPPNHTHQWWLSIGAPTYSLPLGAILERATVTCLSPGTSPIDGPIEVTGPPFFAGGTTAQPFLARLRLEWTSGSLNPPLEVDHWVELDMLHAGAPVLGDEQVLDVELDRQTAFLPVDEPTQGTDPWDLRHGSSRAQAEPAPVLPGYVVLLRSLVPKFPLTLRDMKSKVSGPLPYKLVSSATHFRALVPGRRKAIEWARARALHEAYGEVREEKGPADDYPYLSTGDVFSWLADTGLSLRQVVPQSAPATEPSEKRTSERITPSVINTFCTACGVGSAPRSVAQSSSSWEGPTSDGSCCHSFPLSRFPLLDVGPIASAQSKNRPNGPVQSTPEKKGCFPWSSREILTATDPTLTIAVRCIVTPLRLRCFPESNNASISGASLRPNNCTAITPIADDSDSLIFRSDFDAISESVSVSLASSAVLALAVREFARRLVHSAVTASTSDHTRGAKGSTRAVLTPTHVSAGVLGSFLTRDGVLREIPLSPIALVLATPAVAVRCSPRDLSPPSDIVDISSCRGSVSGVHSSSHCAVDKDVETV